MPSMLDGILIRLKGVTKNGTGYMALCPAHDDHNPSLSIRDDNGHVVLYCFAGCTQVSVCRAIGLTTVDLFDATLRAQRNGNNGRAGPLNDVHYDYQDEQGRLLYQVVRKQYEHDKSFFQRAISGDSPDGWKRGVDGRFTMAGVRRVPYRLPELLASSGPVFVVEGEKDVDRLRELGFTATTNAGGAGKWLPEYSESLTGRSVVILPDNDIPGREHAQAVATSLHGLAADIRVVTLPDLPEKGDVSDWIAAGGTAEKLARVVADAPLWSSPNDQRSGNTSDRRGWNLKTWEEMASEPDESIPFLVEGLLMDGGLSILAALPKVGKSTAVRTLIRCVLRGEPFLGRPVRTGPVILLSLEESRTAIRHQFRLLGIENDAPLHIHVGPSHLKSGEAVDTLMKHVATIQPALVVIDPLFKMAKVRDTNDYAEVTPALDRLLTLARDSGAHVLLVHHNNRADSLLGSVGIAASADCVLTMRKKADGARVLLCEEYRYGSGLEETVIQLDECTGAIYAAGSYADRQTTEVATAIYEIVQGASDGLSCDDIIAQLPEGMKRRNDVYAAIKALTDASRIRKTGDGKRGSPFLYFCI